MDDKPKTHSCSRREMEKAASQHRKKKDNFGEGEIVNIEGINKIRKNTE